MAKYTGYFPSSNPNLRSQNLRVFERKGENWEGRWLAPKEAIPGSERILAAVTNRTNKTPNWFSSWHYGPFSVSAVGSPSLTLPTKIISSDIVKVNNKPFLKKVKNRDVVVSDYKRFQALVTYSNGGSQSTLGEPTSFGRDCWSLQSIGFKSAESLGSWAYNSVFVDNNTAIFGNFVSDYTHMSLTDDVTPYDVGWSDSWIKPFLDNLSVKDESLLYHQIMENTANANKAAVDVLTTLAEAPKTLKSLMTLVKDCLKIYKDCKRREIRLMDKEKRIRSEYVERLKRINYASSAAFKAAKNARQRRIIESKRQRDLKQAKSDFRRLLVDITSAISGVWLQFRYEIIPNVLTIEGIAKSIDEANSTFLRFSKFEVVESNDLPFIEGWEVSARNISLEMRSFIKRRFDVLNQLSGLLKNYSANMFLTAWELIPLSFVVDWFVNVGDLLASSYGGSFLNYIQAATYSLKSNKQAVTYTHKQSGASVTIEISGYLRKVINPDDFCRLIWFPDMNSDRYKDAFALSWQIFLKKLF